MTHTRYAFSRASLHADIARWDGCLQFIPARQVALRDTAGAALCMAERSKHRLVVMATARGQYINPAATG